MAETWDVIQAIFLMRNLKMCLDIMKYYDFVRCGIGAHIVKSSVNGP
jgi:hypothetical protein